MHTYQRLSRFLTSAFTACTLLAPHLPASDEAPAAATFDEVVQLHPVVVVAQSGDTPLTIEIDPRAPAQPIPAHDGADVLRAVPGFNIIRKGGADGDPVLRGMAGSRIGILLDGENILGGCGNRMDPPTAYVFPAAYDRVTVIKGPQSVIHGPGTSAGVVLFERMPRRFETAEARIRGSITVGSAGRNDQFVEAVAGEPRLHLRAAVTRTASDDYRDGDDRLIHSQYERWSAHAGLAWTPDARTFVELSGVVSDGEAAYADRAMDGSAFDRTNIGLRARRTGLTTLIDSVEAQVFYNNVDHVMDNYSLRPFTPTAMMPGRTVSNPDRETFGARATVTLVPGTGIEILAGADFQGNRHSVRSTGNETTDPYRAKSRTRDASFETAGLFAQGTRDFSAHDRLIAGARADFWSATDHRATAAIGMMGSVPNPTAGHDRKTTLPSAFLRYERDFDASTTGYIGLGHAERFPDYWELFNKESAASVSAFDSNPEHTTQIDLGLTHRSGPLTASISLFAAHVDDYLLIENGVAKPAGMMGTRTTTITRNIAARTRGAEAALAWSHGSGWRADASVAWVHADNRTDALPLAQQPPLEGRLGLAYAAQRWSIGGLGRFVDAQDRFALRQGNIVGQDLGATPGFEVFSLHATCQPIESTQLSAGVDNLFDRTYAEHLSRGGAMVAGFPAPTTRVNEPGRTFWLKLDVRY